MSSKIRPLLVAANILINQKGELLMGLRADMLKWEVPGGKVDDELVVEAAARELKEETGIQAEGTAEFVGYVEAAFPHKKKRFVVLCFVWKQWKGFALNKEPEKCLKYQWFPLDKLPDKDACTVGTRAIFETILPAIIEQESHSA